MATGLFKAFRSTVTPFTERPTRPSDRWLAHPVTGAIIGIESPTANGAHGRFTPIDLTAAQILAPTAAMIADLDATYRLTTAPYTRYQSDGTNLVGLAESPDEFIGLPAVLQTVPPGTPLLTIGPNSYLDVWAPFTVQNAAGVSVQGKLTVYNRPA